MAKCRMLYQENEDLGKMITSGKLAKLESDLGKGIFKFYRNTMNSSYFLIGLKSAYLVSLMI